MTDKHALLNELHYHIDNEVRLIGLCNDERKKVLDDIHNKNEPDIDGTIEHLDAYIRHLGDLEYHVRRIRDVAESIRVMANDMEAAE